MQWPRAAAGLPAKSKYLNIYSKVGAVLLYLSLVFQITTDVFLYAPVIRTH